MTTLRHKVPASFEIFVLAIYRTITAAGGTRNKSENGTGSERRSADGRNEIKKKQNKRKSKERRNENWSDAIDLGLLPNSVIQYDGAQNPALANQTFCRVLLAFRDVYWVYWVFLVFFFHEVHSILESISLASIGFSLDFLKPF